MSDLLSSLAFEAYVIAGGVAVALVFYTVLTGVEERAAARSTLRQLDDYEIKDQREQELLAPLRDRLISPALSGLSRFGRRLNPPDYVESVRRKHIQAGYHSQERVERFLAMRILGFVFVPLWLVLILLVNPLGQAGFLHWATAGLGALIGAVGPATSLDRAVDTRRKAVERSLPDVLDLLVISVEAGLGFEQAVDRVIANIPGELSEELARVMGEMQAGASRSDALRGLQERIDAPEVRSFVLAMIQADTFGVSIGRVLRSQGDEMRIKRRQKAQEQAQKAPVKMMIPMVLCIFPALFVVVLGPALINISQNL